MSNSVECEYCLATYDEKYRHICDPAMLRERIDDLAAASAGADAAGWPVRIPLGEESRWDGYPKSAWRKPSLAVVACDGKGHGCVLWTAGPHLRIEIEEIGFHELCDLGLDNAPQGISVWEGTVHYVNTSNPLGPDEGAEPITKGVFRKPTLSEWASFVHNSCPWDDADWRKSDDGT